VSAAKAAQQEADRVMATQLEQLEQLQDELRGERARLEAQAAQLESWQGQLAAQQAMLEELEGAAAEALSEAREAAAAALTERDTVRVGRLRRLLAITCVDNHWR
jgi:peptidoglycan hydrolase CwlO-like protein